MISTEMYVENAMSLSKSINIEQKKLVTIGIGEMKISTNPNEILVTYALGSCIALTLYDPYVRVGGMIHCKLPKSENYTNNRNSSVHTFVDTGVLDMYEQIQRKGAQKRHITAKLAGAAGMMNDNEFFKIGKQNYAVMCEILKILSIVPRARDVGGSNPRTLYLHIDTGKTFIKSGITNIEL